MAGSKTLAPDILDSESRDFFPLFSSLGALANHRQAHDHRLAKIDNVDCHVIHVGLQHMIGIHVDLLIDPTRARVTEMVASK